VNILSSLESKWGKNRQSPNKLSVKLPSQKIRNTFLLIYEFKGCQKATNYLSEYYSIKKIKLLYKNKSITKYTIAWYSQDKAYLTNKGLKKRVVLHEFYHHLIKCKNIDLKLKQEEKEATLYAREFLQYRRDT
jgi:hypothetical protein